MIEGAQHLPYSELERALAPDGKLGAARADKLLFFCAYGERSAMAVEAARKGGLSGAYHLDGGIDAWKKAGRPVKLS